MNAKGMDADVLIAGGGAAGLAAADVLGRAGCRSIVIEARERLGGRLASVRDARSPVAYEYGPEFVHGTPEVTLSRLRRAGATVVDCAEAGGWLFEPGTGLRPQTDDPFEAVTEVLRRVPAADGDESVAAFLDRLGPQDAATAEWARSLVAGFDAADPARASVRAIAAEWLSDASADGAQSRPLRGYATLVDELVRALDPGRVRTLTRHVLRSLHAEPDGVCAVVTGSSPDAPGVELRAAHAIVTLPLGVLQREPHDGGIAFEPPLSPAKRRALGRLAMGPVRKVGLLYATPFWEQTAGGRYRDAAFFHQSGTGASAPAYPTFWTQVPVRAPLVVAWAGGPAAEALAALDDDAASRLAAREFGAMLGDQERAAASLVATFTWDWQRDPFARGAYSYVTTGGEDARAALAAPEGRLAFAGEATAGEGEGGTVAGALLSGERAAREIFAMRLRSRERSAAIL